MVENGDYTIGDLDQDSWPLFEELFKKYNGVQNSCWCVYYHRDTTLQRARRKGTIESNHDLKKRLVVEGNSRSVLVYKGDKVVASCQYGTFQELPRVDNFERYSNLNLEKRTEKLWRITCFFVDKPHRHRGLAKIALDAVLDRVAKNGGGVVEAYPVTKKNTFEIWFGTLNMFLERGFEVVSDFGKSNALVRKTIEPRDSEYDRTPRPSRTGSKSHTSNKVPPQ